MNNTPQTEFAQQLEETSSNNGQAGDDHLVTPTYGNFDSAAEFLESLEGRLAAERDNLRADDQDDPHWVEYQKALQHEARQAAKPKSPGQLVPALLVHARAPGNDDQEEELRREARRLRLIYRAAKYGKTEVLAVIANSIENDPRKFERLIYMDVFELGSAVQRDRFAEAVAATHRFIEKAEVEMMLLQAAAEGEPREQPARNKQKPAEPTADDYLRGMSEDVKAEARAMLKDPLLMQQLDRDIESLGIVGEKKLGRTLYLSSTSRKLAKPASAIITSPSSTGKTYIARRTVSMIPPEDVVDANAMSRKALYHFPNRDTALAHKVVIMGERAKSTSDKQADATAPMRQLLSDDVLSYAYVDSSGGAPVTITVTIPGPISLIETTTSTTSEIFNEDLNRCLILSADETKEQTSRVLHQIGKASAGLVEDQSKSIRLKHWAIQRMLKPKSVLVPFGEALAAHFPPDRPEARRGITMLLAITRASALFHQYQRPDIDGSIVADLADYTIARELCLTPLSRLLGGMISGAAIRFHERLTNVHVWSRENGVAKLFTTTDAWKGDRHDEKAVRTWLRELEHVGAVELHSENRGNAFVWKLTSMPHDEVAAGGFDLPEADELQRYMDGLAAKQEPPAPEP